MSVPSPDLEDRPGALASLARLHGLQVSFAGADGRRHRVSDEVTIQLLRALGVPIERPDDAAGLAALASARRASRPVAPVLVERGARPGVHRATLPVDSRAEAAWVEIVREDGSSERHRLSDLVSRPPASEDVDGRAVAHHELRLPAPLPAGYHRLRVESEGLEGEALLLRAPGRCPLPERGWGLFAPVHALRGEDDWGVGGYRELGNLLDWSGRLGARFVSTLPIFATFLDGPLEEPSPYLPVSRLAWNELYLDVTTLPEVGYSAEVRACLESGVTRDATASLRRLRLADPVRAMAAKRAVLERAAAACFRSPGRHGELVVWLEAHPEVAAYARFRACLDAGGDPSVERYHSYVQWMADLQLADAAERGHICVDLPVGVHPRGFDPSWQPDAFVAGASGGAPPDAFAADGQDWGIRPLHPEGIREQGYGYVIAMLRTAMRHAGVVRIDHVMGLHRMYLVPEGGEARHGAYVRYRSEELHAIVVLEATRAGVAVVGEDLGTVPAEVRPAMRRSGLLRSFVWQFEGTPDDPLPEPPVDAVASLGTHDLATFAAFWGGDDIAERRSEGRIDDRRAGEERGRRRALTESTSRALEPASQGTLPSSAAFAGCAEYLGGGAATLALLDTADLWGERQPQNRPGTAVAQGSFRLRYPQTVACLARDHDAVALLKRVDEARRRPGP